MAPCIKALHCMQSIWYSSIRTGFYSAACPCEQAAGDAAPDDLVQATSHQCLSTADHQGNSAKGAQADENAAGGSFWRTAALSRPGCVGRAHHLPEGEASAHESVKESRKAWSFAAAHL